MPRTLTDTPKYDKRPALNDAIRLDKLTDTSLPEYDDEGTWFVDATYTGRVDKVRYHYTDLGRAMAAVLQTTEQKKGSAA
jgi:hypothetical protein